MVTTIKTKFENPTEEELKSLKNHSPDNYKTVILQNYYLYNHRARLDVANVLYDKLVDLKKNHPGQLAAQKTLFLEIFSKYMQIVEDLALISLMLLDESSTKQAYEIYMETKNPGIEGFYKRAYIGFSEDEILKILGLHKIKQYIDSSRDRFNPEEVNNHYNLLNETIKIEINNMKMLAKLYLEEVTIDGKVTLKTSGTVDLYNSVKHAFRLVHPTPLTKTIWKDIKQDSVEAMHKLIIDDKAKTKIISIGGFENVDDALINNIMTNTNLYSEEIKNVSEFALWARKDPMFVIKKLRLLKTRTEIENKKTVGRNEPCLCGSGIKYKKCCDEFEYEYDHFDPYSILKA